MRPGKRTTRHSTSQVKAKRTGQVWSKCDRCVPTTLCAQRWPAQSSHDLLTVAATETCVSSGSSQVSCANIARLACVSTVHFAHYALLLSTSSPTHNYYKCLRCSLLLLCMLFTSFTLQCILQNYLLFFFLSSFSFLFSQLLAQSVFRSLVLLTLCLFSLSVWIVASLSSAHFHVKVRLVLVSGTIAEGTKYVVNMHFDWVVRLKRVKNAQHFYHEPQACTVMCDVAFDKSVAFAMFASQSASFPCTNKQVCLNT